ncbi:HlyD family efflux transporter periplasmic adaptor subunit [Clostridium sp. P21]|uniref:HlyD family efflux transporter periplasmic adaptor subunit n=1 Tax=Clostridium muellerianum TaxID=2716538 RepID=A0A7Y0EGS7_9CLOT|nr:HlyD family efflux transporter periplasmic adaptor subunit [Clostridium muellerianum]NMM63199.1 HlyD family efflux transporter periplasmic adaptor subunit [Clostridium muellerianum]
MNKKNAIKLGILLLVLILSTSSFFIFKSLKDKQSNSFIYSGTAEADTINVTSETSGKIGEIKVKEGSKVKSGELVAIISSDETQVNLQNSEISIKNAENELGKIQDGNRIEEIKAQQAVVEQFQAAVKQGESTVESSKNNLNSANTNYNYKKKLYDDTVSLYNSGSEAKYKVDAAKNDLDNASSTVNNAKDALNGSEAQLNNYKSQLNAATEKLNLLVNGATEREKNSAQYNVDKAKKSYELSKIALDKNNLTATIDGIVQTINFKQGEYVTPGTPVATLIDTKNLWVKIYVPESMLTNINLNKNVTLTNDFIKNKTIKGKIIYISPTAEFTPMNIVTKKDRMKMVYGIKVQILDNLDIVKSGMLFDVNLK